MPTNFIGSPGIRTILALTPRNIFVAEGEDTVYGPSPFIIDGTLSRDPGSTPVSLLRNGLLLGRITASHKYRPSIIGLTTDTIGGTDTSITVAAATATEVARLIAVAAGPVNITIAGPPTTAGTVASEVVAASAASGTTITTAAITNDYATGSLIQPDDGSQIPKTVFYNVGEYGIDVTDIQSQSVDQYLPAILQQAYLIAAMIPNLTTGDSSVEIYLKTQLRAASGGTWMFDDDFN